MFTPPQTVCVRLCVLRVQRVRAYIRSFCDVLAAWPDVPGSELACLLCDVLAAWPDVPGSELACLLCDVLAAWPDVPGSELACLLCNVLAAWPGVPGSKLACLTLLALGICRLWCLSDSSSILLTDFLIKWRKARSIFVCLRRLFMYASIRLLLVHWMKALRASFFARESASNSMVQTQCAATVAKIKNICKLYHGPPQVFPLWESWVHMDPRRRPCIVKMSPLFTEILSNFRTRKRWCLKHI